MMKFENQSVVITGASSGMGRAIALCFAKEGATVIAVARRKERLEALARESESLPGKILPYAGDISLQEVNEGMIDYAVQTCGKLDILVNNAGIMDEFRPITEVSNEYWEKIFRVNLTGPMFAMRKAVQVMTAQGGGNIINIASIGGVRGCRAGAAYTASKHALVGLTKNTAFMYAAEHIRCNAVCPGGVDTEVMDTQTEISQKGLGRVMAGIDQSIGTGSAEEIASMVLYLAGEESRFVNGAAIVVDGGVSCN